jgi:Ni/Co efflux regulator RcnB
MAIMKKMIFSLIAAMMLLGTVNSNAQRNVRNDKPRQEIRKDADRRLDQPRQQKAFNDRRDDRMYVMRDNPRQVKVVEALPPRDPRPRHTDQTTNTAVAAAVGAAVGALIPAVTR